MKNKQRQIYKIPPLLLKPPCTRNAQSQKRTAKGSNIKEHDRALPLIGGYYYICRLATYQALDVRVVHS